MMHGREVAFILAICVLGLLALTLIFEETERGRRFTSKAIVRVMGDRRRYPRVDCCAIVRANRSEADYWLHRVRQHGEGAL
jgi:hypothetical protein